MGVYIFIEFVIELKIKCKWGVFLFNTVLQVSKKWRVKGVWVWECFFEGAEISNHVLTCDGILKGVGF